MAGELPPADSKHRSADTYVFLAMEDGSILANSSPYGFLGKIERAVVEKGYGGSLSVEGHVFEDLSDMFPYDFYWGHNFYVTIDAGFDQPLLRIFSKLILYPREKKSNLLILSNFKEFEEANELEEVRRCLEARGINVVLAHIDKVIKPDECECNAEFVLLEDSLLAGCEMPLVPDCEFVDWQAELRKLVPDSEIDVPDCGTEVPDYESMVPSYGSEGPDYNDLGFDYYKPRFNIGSDGYVFWDIQDYPIPDENCAETFFSNIKANLAMRGCKNVRIYAYILSKTSIMSSVHLLRKYGFIPICLREEICVLVLPSDLLDKHVLLDMQIPAIGTINGIWRMLLDIYICSAGSAGNIFVVSKKFTEKDHSLHYLENLYSRGFGVFLSNPGRDCTLALPKESNASFLRSLFMKNS